MMDYMLFECPEITVTDSVVVQLIQGSCSILALSKDQSICDQGQVSVILDAPPHCPLKICDGGLYLHIPLIPKLKRGRAKERKHHRLFPIS